MSSIPSLSEHRIKGYKYWYYFFRKLLPDIIKLDIKLYNINFPNTFDLISGKIVILMLDYETTQDIEDCQVFVQYLKIKDRFERLYKKDMSCILMFPYVNSPELKHGD